jgi:hypothetical protein
MTEKQSLADSLQSIAKTEKPDFPHLSNVDFPFSNVLAACGLWWRDTIG